MISYETLLHQSEIAERSGRRQLAENLRRAAEVVQVPDDFILEVYNALRPRRSTATELAAYAVRLRDEFHAPHCAPWVEEAAAHCLRSVLPQLSRSAIIRTIGN